MSAGIINGTTDVQELPEDDTILELCDGENPVQFLTSNGETIYGMISGMSDRDRIEGWRRAERRFIDSTRTEVLEALDRQEAALEAGQAPPIYHPFHDRYDPETDPLVSESERTPKSTAEQHTETTDSQSEQQSESEAPSESPSSEEPVEPHPDANLEADECLDVQGPDGREVLFAASVDADEPYVCVVFDGERVDSVTLIAETVAFRRLTWNHEKTSVDEIDVEIPPEAAATGGRSE